MSILIKGMEMPEHCGDCLFYGLESAGNGMYWDYCRCRREPIDNPDTDRRSDCPLAPVPLHGRLGDLDELYKLFLEKAKEHKNAGGAMVAMAALCIANAPTIIEAEEGE